MRQWLDRQFRPASEAKNAAPSGRLLRHGSGRISENDLLKFVAHQIGSFYGSPNPMHIIVVFEGLEKFAGMLPLFVGQFRKALCDVAELARDHRPPVAGEPLG